MFRVYRPEIGRKGIAPGPRPHKPAGPAAIPLGRPPGLHSRIDQLGTGAVVLPCQPVKA